jgi:anti-sigma factor RsiW
VELVADYLDDALSPEMRARFEEHLAGCDGCTTYLSQTQRVMAELRDLSTVSDHQIADPEDHPQKTERP